MSIDLTSCRTQLSQRLQDTSNLIYSTGTLDESLRSALADLSASYGSAQTLDGLDGETSTTFSSLDLHTFLVGGVAYSLRSRFTGKLDEPNPSREKPGALADQAASVMKEFQSLLHHIRVRRFQETTDHPYSLWDWDEGDDFS